MWIQLLGVVYNLDLVRSFQLDLTHQVINGGKGQIVIPAIKLHYAKGETKVILYHNHLDDDYVKDDYQRLVDMVGPITPMSVEQKKAEMQELTKMLSARGLEVRG